MRWINQMPLTTAKKMVWRYAPSVFRMLSKRYTGQIFSISMFEGERLDHLKPAAQTPCPLLTHSDVTDMPAVFVADPFMIRKSGQWFMFFEVMDRISRQGKIGVASSADLRRWQYDEIVLDEAFHLAYPYVFEHNGNAYMIPDSPGNGVRLYKADAFPSGWSLVKEIRRDNIYCDSSIVEHNGLWWLFSAWAPDKSSPKVLRLFSADGPEGDWVEHPGSPVQIEDQKIIRPGGRIFKDRSGRLFRFAQDGTNTYGESVYAVQILELNMQTYREQRIEKPILGPGDETWCRGGMHHIDVHCLDNQLICCVDGWHQS